MPLVRQYQPVAPHCPVLQEDTHRGSTRRNCQHACIAIATVVMLAGWAALTLNLGTSIVTGWGSNPVLRSSLSLANRSLLFTNRRLAGNSRTPPARIMGRADAPTGSVETHPDVRVTLAVASNAVTEPDIFWGSATAAYQVCTPKSHTCPYEYQPGVYAGSTHIAGSPDRNNFQQHGVKRGDAETDALIEISSHILEDAEACMHLSRHSHLQIRFIKYSQGSA